ncbi:MAG: carboxypeptidase-like regulatory domain-containing protein, partial [Bacteroidota bacterium]
MIRNSCLFLFVFFHVLALPQATFDVEGRVVANVGKMSLSGVLVHLKGKALEQQTKTDGTFAFANVPPGNYTLRLARTGYHTMTLPIVVDAHLNMGSIPLKLDLVQELTNSITLTEHDLNADDYTVETTSVLLRASRDVFSGIAAFEFGQTFFRPRGLDSENAVVLINGIAMNALFNGRPQWNNWGGLNDITRNQEVAPGLSPSDYHFGGLLGTTHISTRASDYSPRLRLSASSSNRSYAGRLMATYSSGFQNKAFAYTVAVSRRWAAEGFVEGALYDAYSLFGAFEYRPHKNHSLNFSAVYTPVRSGRTAPNTQEVFDLKGSRYNPYWGYQDGRIRNSRIRRIKAPLFMLSHYWAINSKSKLTTTIACQTGKVGNSRL